MITDKMKIHKEDFFQMSHLRTQDHPFKIFKKHAKKLTRINTFSRRIVNDWNLDGIKAFRKKHSNIIHHTVHNLC